MKMKQQLLINIFVVIKFNYCQFIPWIDISINKLDDLGSMIIYGKCTEYGNCSCAKYAC